MDPSASVLSGTDADAAGAQRMRSRRFGRGGLPCHADSWQMDSGALAVCVVVRRLFKAGHAERGAAAVGRLSGAACAGPGKFSNVAVDEPVAPPIDNGPPPSQEFADPPAPSSPTSEAPAPPAPTPPVSKTWFPSWTTWPRVVLGRRVSTACGPPDVVRRPPGADAASLAAGRRFGFEGICADFREIRAANRARETILRTRLTSAGPGRLPAAVHPSAEGHGDTFRPKRNA